jgi:Ca2+-binding RTX toxin-like protein
LFNASLTTGITDVNADRSNSNVTITGLEAGAAVGMIGNAAVVNGIVSFAYATATSAQIINISGGTLKTGVANITATASAGVTTATINSTGAANKVDAILLDSAGANTITSLTINATTGLTANLTANNYAATGAITITGAGAVDLSGVAVNVKTIDASANSGGVTIAAGTNTTSVKGSSGNDTITSAAVAATATLDGGAGTDTLVINAATDLDTVAEAAKYSNFETLQTATSFDHSLLSGITALNVTATAGATAFTNMTVAQAADVTISGAINAAGITFGLASALGTTDVLTAKIGNAATAAGTSVDADSITANGIETFNFEAVHGASATAGAQKTAVIADFTANVVTAINLTGSSFDLEDLATTKAVTIDGTALTGNGAATNVGLKVAGSAVALSTIKGSEVVDQFTIGAVGSTYQGNGGKDTFTSTTEAILAGSVAIDGGAGADTLTMSATGATTTGTTTIGDTTWSKMSAIETVNLSGVYAGDLVWTLGGFANALATSNGGVLKVTAAAVATAVTADAITVDASNLTGTNALELTLTNTIGNGSANAGTDTYTGGAGNDKFIINYDANHANDDSIVTITAGAGDDTITFTMGSGTSSPGTITLTGGAGADTITGSVELDTITGGAGTDTMTGNGGADIFVITTVTDSNAATAGAIDKITDFVGGGVDDLKVGANATELNSETITAVYDAADTIAELNVLLNSTNGTATTARFDGTGADAAKLTLADGRILTAVDVDASGTFTAADVVVEMTGLTGTLANTDIIV